MWETIKTQSLENEGVCFLRGRGQITSMASCKTAVTPLLTHWSYCNLALSHRHDISILKSGWYFVVDLPGNMRFKHAPLIELGESGAKWDSGAKREYLITWLLLMPSTGKHTYWKTFAWPLFLRHQCRCLLSAACCSSKRVDYIYTINVVWAIIHCVTTEKVPAKYRSLKMADASFGKCSIFVYSGGIAWTRHRLCKGVQKSA